MQTCREPAGCPQKFNFTIGCDPEFAIASGLSAYASIRRSKLWRGRNYYDDPCGLDGAPRIFELRPKSAPCAHLLVENISEAFRQEEAYFRRSKQTFIAHPCHRFPCGGHIHFGIWPEGRTYSREEVGKVNYLVGLLDAWLIPTIREVYPDAGWKRRERGYGQPGAKRDKSYGFEYRTPPTFLAEKGLALSVLSLAGAIVEWGLENDNYDFPTSKGIKELPKHPAFAKRWSEISYLDWLSKNGRKIREDRDIRKVWL